jgi:VWFA-related protein
MVSRFRTVLLAGLIAVALTETQGAQQPTSSQTPRQQIGQQQPSQQQPNQQPDQQQPDQPQAPAGQPPPVFRTGINFVRVDVIVTDKNGNSVSDLNQTDFEVTELGKLQTVETFKRVDLDGGLIPGPDGPPRAIRTDNDEELEAARDDVRLFGLFLDDYHVRRLSSLSTRNDIARFIETQLGPSDMIGLMYPLTPLDAVRFTRNHDVVMRAVQQFNGRKFEYEPKNPVEERYSYYPATTVELIRNDVSLSALKALIIHMGSLKEGRKALLLVSEGYSNMLPPQLQNPCAACGSIGNPQAGNPMAGGGLLESRLASMASFDMNDSLRLVYDLANKNNVAIYAIDPRRLATNEFDISENINIKTDTQYLNSTMETLRTLAFESDGRAIVNRNDLTTAMKQIVRDTSSYYLLGYNSTLAPTDGKFHEIKVRVKRSGVQVRARRGYWAVSQEDIGRMTAIANPKPGPPKAVESALAAISQPSRARVVRTWIGTDRGTDGRTKVSFVWEPVPRAPGDTLRSSETAARVTVTAIAPDGSPYFRGRVPDAAPAPAAGTVSSSVVFDAPPGQMQLRLSVESADAQVIDSEVREITVPDLTSQTALSTPAVFRVRTARELQQLKADPKAVPTAAREFTRTERLLIRVTAYGPAATAPTLTARLLNRAGKAMNDLQVTPPASASAPSEIDLPLASLSSGEYLLEITAAGESGITELVGFRVTG